MLRAVMDLLAGTKVAVAAWGPAAAMAGWLLSRYGAQVEMSSALDPEGLGAFLAEAARYDTAPRIDPAGATLFITDAPLTEANRRAVDALSPATTCAWITPWGLEGEWAGRPATPLCLQAAGGWMAAVGEPGREPIGPPGSQAEIVAGYFAAAELLAAQAFPMATRPRLISVPVVEAVLATTIYDAVAFQYYGRVRERAGNRFAVSQPTLMTLPCKDGHIGIHAALHAQWLSMCEVIGHPEMASDPRFANPAERILNIEAMDREFLLPWLATRTRFEAYHELQAARVPNTPMPTMEDVLASPQLAARDAWRTVQTPGGRRLTIPGEPARVLAEREGTAATSGGPWEPGALRVVDLSMGWAGPLVSHVLACHGADVIKVESHHRFDWWRGSRPPGDDPELQLHERSHVFNAVNRGKRGLTLDLTSGEGRGLLLRLASTADVVVENFGAGVLERLGIDYATLSELNRRLVLLRQPAFGGDGPEANYVAFGNTIEGMSGLSSITGYEGGPPSMLSNALGDPVSGIGGAVAVLSALIARERDGRGRCIEAAQLEGFLPLTAEALIETQVTGQVPRRRGNGRPGHEPSGVFPCEGDDAWVAIEVRDGDDWTRLAAAIGEEWMRDGALATLVGRESRRVEIAERLSAWTSGRTVDGVVGTLAVAGVPCAPVNHEPEVLSSEPFSSAGFYVGVEREVVGFYLYPSLPALLDGERPLPARPAPLLGEHNDEILDGLGVGPAEREKLAADGVIGRMAAAQRFKLVGRGA